MTLLLAGGAVYATTLLFFLCLGKISGDAERVAENWEKQ